MLVRLPGWTDGDVLALLSLVRKHLLYYVYTCDNAFVTEIHTELPRTSICPSRCVSSGAHLTVWETILGLKLGVEKRVGEIQAMVRSLMVQFALGLSTKNFRTDGTKT